MKKKKYFNRRINYSRIRFEADRKYLVTFTKGFEETFTSLTQTINFIKEQNSANDGIIEATLKAICTSVTNEISIIKHNIQILDDGRNKI